MGASIFKTVIKRPEHTRYQGEDDDEIIEILLRKSMYSLVVKFLIVSLLFISPLFLVPFLAKATLYKVVLFDGASLLVLTLFFYLVAFGFLFEIIIDWFYEVFLVTNKKIVDIGKDCRSISETPLINVQDVTSKIHGAIGEILNIGSVIVQTAGESREFGIDLVDNPSLVRDAISDLVTKGKIHGNF
jgi:hypothetical protein